LPFGKAFLIFKIKIILDLYLISELLLIKKANPKAFENLISLAKKEFENYNHQINTHFLRKDLNDVKFFVHKLKGGSAGLGFQKVREVCLLIENKITDNEDVTYEINSISKYLSDSFDAIEKFESETQ
jgi:HPt (histidine-containing phosphotransfer) domain-containing protein